MNIALLTAAGKGTRMHTEIPKQFLHINNKPVILYTMEAFQKHPQIDAILVVTLDTWKDMIWAYARQYQIDKLRWVVTGGDTGQESINRGLQALKEECNLEDGVVIHDGNRPMVSEDIISDSIATFKSHGNAVAAIPCVEAIYRSSNGEKSTETLDRQHMFRTQTPHTYSLGKLLWAHEKAREQGIESTTATCTLMTLLGETIYFSRGSEKNIKLTAKDDIDIFEALLKREQRNGIL